MSFLHSSIFFIHFRLFGKLIYHQCIKNFTLRRTVITLGFLLTIILSASMVFVFRLLDEIFFFSYRTQEVKQPIFIISNPRSGTTFTHRLMCMDEDKYAFTSLYHTTFPSITLFKVVNVFSRLDNKIGHPMEKGIKALDKILFKGWENIHPMGWGKSEEDEAMYVYTGYSAGMFFLSPFIKDVYEIVFPDTVDEKVRKKIMNFYTNSIQRVMFAQGHNKIFLSKNVMSTGRLKSLNEAYPDARYIYLVRNPMEAIPSLMSMFSIPWNFHSPEIKYDSPEFRAVGTIGIDYYKYFNKFKNRIDPKNMITVNYEDLVNNPKETIEKIYDHFDLEIDEKYNQKLSAITKKQKSYTSGHDYSLEQFGMTSEQVYKELDFIFEEYDFGVLQG
ncbi:MAG: sulfotransferase [Bacteroidetes bacterium]|nr:sulfotransferase [Bacteroidota bacterium]